MKKYNFHEGRPHYLELANFLAPSAEATCALAQEFEDFCQDDPLKIHAVRLAVEHGQRNNLSYEFYLDRAKFYALYLHNCQLSELSSAQSKRETPPVEIEGQ